MYTIPSADTYILYIDIPGYHISPDPNNPYLPFLPHLHSPPPPYPHNHALPLPTYPAPSSLPIPPPMHTPSMFTQLN